MLLSGASLALDYVKLNVLTQSLQAGYLPDNPPLFEWTLFLIQSVFGPTRLSFVLIIGVFFVAAVFFTYLAAVELFDRRWAAFAALSLILFFQLGWNFFQTFTHSAALIAATFFFWWSILRVIRDQDFYSYVLVGLAIGIGLQSKYSFAGVLIAALIAVFLRRETRRAFFAPGIFISVVVASILLIPHFLWLYAQNQLIVEVAADRLQSNETSYFLKIFTGLPAAIWALVSFFLPFILIAVAIFGRKKLQSWNDDPRILLLKDAALIGGLLVLISVFVAGLASMQERYVIALMIPAIFWMIAKLRSAHISARQMTVYLASVAAVAVATLSVKTAQILVPGPPFCRECRQWVPYEAIKFALDQQGFVDGTLVGLTDHTAGNLRRLYPHARVLSSYLLFYTPAGGAMDDDCYFIWSTDLGPEIPEHLARRLANEATYEVIGEWQHFLKRDGWRQTVWTVAKLDQDPSLKKALCRPAAD